MRDKRWKRVIDRIHRKMTGAGFDNIFDFHKRSGVADVPMAYYTCVRVFDHDRQPPSIPTLIAVAHYAGCTKAEIKEALAELGDAFWSAVIGDDCDGQIDPREAAVIDALRIITEHHPDLWASVAANLTLLAKAAGVDIAKQSARVSG